LLSGFYLVIIVITRFRIVSHYCFTIGESVGFVKVRKEDETTRHVRSIFKLDFIDYLSRSIPVDRLYIKARV